MTRWYKYWRTFTVHPDLKINYFENINTTQTPTIGRKCKKYGVSMPERGYWKKVYWAEVRSSGRNEKETRSNNSKGN